MQAAPGQKLTEPSLVKVATCNLAQQALNFAENKKRILESINKARSMGCTYRLGPELEIPGYGCEDHFYELDTKTFSWICLKEIMLETPPGIMCDVGLPVTHNGVLYNCRLFYVTNWADDFNKLNKAIVDAESALKKVQDDISKIKLNANMASGRKQAELNSKYATMEAYEGEAAKAELAAVKKAKAAAAAAAKPKIVLIRPKMYLADDGNYREGRYFTGWSRDNIEVLDKFVLPDDIAAITGQTEVDFGVGIIEAHGITVASETCEELFTPEAPNIMLGLEGVDIMSNGSASHFQMGKYQYRHQLISEAMSKNGGVYMYSNQLGCDGGRLVFDGHGMIYQNGNLLSVGEHLSFLEVEVVTAVVNLDAVRTYRATTVSRNIQSAHKKVTVPRVYVDKIEGLENFSFLNKTATASGETQTKSSSVVMSHFEVGKPMSNYEEMSLAISRYLWDYLVRTANGGFFLPLSGGVDSSSTAMYVYMMCNKLVQMINDDSPAKKSLRDLIVNGLFFKALSGYQFLKYKNYYTGTKVDGVVGEPLTTRALVNVLLHTANMPTENNAAEIRNFAEKLAHALGSYHITVHINEAFIALKNLTEGVELKNPNVASLLLPTVSANEYYPDVVRNKGQADMNIPRFKNSANGDWQSNLAIQNIQARLRMLTAYYSQQILPATRFNLEVLGNLWTNYRRIRDEITKTKATEGKLPENMEFLDEMMVREDNQMDAKNAAEFLKLYNFYKGTYSWSPFFQEPYVATFSHLHKTLVTTARPAAPGLLVLASSNADEALRGFYTKYDASSADINPIGSLDKSYLKKFMAWCAQTNAIHDPALQQLGYQFNMLEDIINVTASPELTPADKQGNIQDDEVAITMTYDDLQILGELRKIHKLGPLGIYRKLLEIKMNAYHKDDANSSSLISVVDGVRKFREVVCPLAIREKVFFFFKQYAMNRHKMNILTNAIHLTNYSPDDNRFDHRPFLLNTFWGKHFEVINKIAAEEQAAWAASKKGEEMKAHFKDKYPRAYESLKIDTWTDVSSREKALKDITLQDIKNGVSGTPNVVAQELKDKESAESKETWDKIWADRKARAGPHANVIDEMHKLDDIDEKLKMHKILSNTGKNGAKALKAEAEAGIAALEPAVFTDNLKYNLKPYSLPAAGAPAAGAEGGRRGRLTRKRFAKSRASTFRR